MLRVNSLIGFGANQLRDITVTDDGDAALSSGSGTATHTINTQTSTGPVSVICLTWELGAGNVTLDSLTWNGVAMSILVQAERDEGVRSQGAAIAIINGAQSGNVVATYSGNVDDTDITKLSLTNVSSLTAVDTDSDTSAAGGATLDGLSSPGAGGVRIACYANTSDGTAVSWTNATEASDLDGGNHRHSAAYDLGDDATAITADGAVSDEVIVGASIR